MERGLSSAESETRGAMMRTRRAIGALAFLLVAGTCFAQAPRSPAAANSSLRVQSVKCAPARFCGGNSNTSNLAFRRFGGIYEVVVLSLASAPGAAEYEVRDPNQRITAASWQPGDSAVVALPGADHACPQGNGAVLLDNTKQEWVCAAYASGGEGKIAKIDNAYDHYMSREEVDIHLGDVEPRGAYSLYVVEDPAAVKLIASSWQAGDTIVTLSSDSQHPCPDLASQVLLDSRTNQWVCSFLQKR